MLCCGASNFLEIRVPGSSREYSKIFSSNSKIFSSHSKIFPCHSNILENIFVTRVYSKIFLSYSSILEHTRTYANKRYFGGDFTQNCTHIQHSHRFTQQNNNHETMRESLSSQANPSSQSGRRSICDPQTAIGINAENAIKIGLRIRKHLCKQKKRTPSPPAIYSLLEEEEAEPHIKEPAPCTRSTESRP